MYDRTFNLDSMRNSGTKQLVWLLNENITAFLLLFMGSGSWAWLFFLFHYFDDFIFFCYLTIMIFAFTSNKTLCICRFTPSSSSSPLRLFRNIGEFGAKRYFTENPLANTSQLFLNIKGNSPGLFFFWTSPSEEKVPRDYLINLATCLFAYH